MRTTRCAGLFAAAGRRSIFLKRYPNLPLTRQQMLDGMDELITSRYETIAKPKDGVIELLEGLRARGVKMAIATLTARRHAEKALIDPRHDEIFRGSCSPSRT